MGLRASVIQALEGSTESYHDTIDYYYATILHRLPDLASLNSWTGTLASGAITVNDLGRAFLASDEYFAWAGLAIQ